MAKYLSVDRAYQTEPTTAQERAALAICLAQSGLVKGVATAQDAQDVLTVGSAMGLGAAASLSNVRMVDGAAVPRMTTASYAARW